MTERAKHRGILSRSRRSLLLDTTGNTAAIMAAALFPIIGLVGGAVDMSRGYMAKARLQQACDAGAVAARRSMGGDTFSSDDQQEGEKYFDFNFPDGKFGAAVTSRVFAAGQVTGNVDGDASATLPVTLMRLFGMEELTLNVSCSSRLDVGNTDIVLVLDTTGSMEDEIDMGDEDGDGESDGEEEKIVALRRAVSTFYGVLGAGGGTSGRVRYAVVPYSSTVNVGYLLPASKLVGSTAGETWTYPSRRMRYQRHVANTPTNSSCKQIYGLSSCSSNPTSTGTVITSAQCTSYAGNTSFSGSSGLPSATSGGGPAPTATVTYTYGTAEWGVVGDTSGTNRTCRRTRTAVTTTYTTETVYTPTAGYTIAGWEYTDVAHNVSTYITGVSTTNPAYHASYATDSYSWNSSTRNWSVPSTTTWAGCIEERDTLNTITSTHDIEIPANAYDMQIDLDGTSTATRWRPFWPQVVYATNPYPYAASYNSGQSGPAPSGYSACPTQSRKLAEYATYDSNPAYFGGATAPTNDAALGSFRTYIDNLQPIGGTYHDIGLIWGARLLSATGLFSAENSAAPNGLPISRHIVFMTDGIMMTSGNSYTGWGINDRNGRLASTSTGDTTLTAIHNRRLEMMCEAVKDQDVTIWVVTFGSPLGTQLSNCATSTTQHALQATTSAQLVSLFSRIAQSIGGLRLTS